jgi:hypothetical protein
MNEEITQAIEQLRQRPSDQPWFIPALLSDCEIPDISIGAGETLRSFHWVTLYDNWDDGVQRILNVVQPEREEEVVNDRQSNTYSEEDILDFIPSSITSVLNDRKRERTAEKFSLIQDNYRTHEYSRQEIDKLAPSQRGKLFTAAPEMEAWWRGKSIADGAWPLFRLRGGTWLSVDQIAPILKEHLDTVCKIPCLYEWFTQNFKF